MDPKLKRFDTNSPHDGLQTGTSKPTTQGCFKSMLTMALRDIAVSVMQQWVLQTCLNIFKSGFRGYSWNLKFLEDVAAVIVVSFGHTFNYVEDDMEPYQQLWEVKGSKDTFL